MEVHYPTDIVFCIDVSSSMRNYIENVKKMVIEYKDVYINVRESLAMNIGEIRSKVILFGNKKHGKKIQVSPFYTMPAQEDEFKTYVNGLEVDHGEDEPECDGYEVLLEAFKSDWVKDGGRRRWITVLFTDAPAYTEKQTQLIDDWNALDSRAKRLLIFAPDDPSWSDLTKQFPNTIHYQSKAGEGLALDDKNAICCAIIGGI